MADRSAEPWYPTAAYLYVLHLDELALAWEYLRRHPDYRRDWLLHRSSPDTAQCWGLRLLEDPMLDARDAQPAWLPGHGAVVQLHPDADPPREAAVFSLWDIPGHKQLVHDGNGLALISRSPSHCTRFLLAPGLSDGMACVRAVRTGAELRVRCRAITAELDEPAMATTAMVRSRPTPAALLELHTVQVLDAALAGASLREIAQGLFGADAVDAGWHADGGLRSRVRRLLRRGQALMRGGYRNLARID